MNDFGRLARWSGALLALVLALPSSACEDFTIPPIAGGTVEHELEFGISQQTLTGPVVYRLSFVGDAHEQVTIDALSVTVEAPVDREPLLVSLIGPNGAEESTNTPRRTSNTAPEVDTYGVSLDSWISECGAAGTTTDCTLDFVLDVSRTASANPLRVFVTATAIAGGPPVEAVTFERIR